MSVVVINAVNVPAGRGAEFEERFARRAGQVGKAEGFEAFELLRPAEGTRYFVYTRWRSAEDFQAWMSSRNFAEGHRQHSEQGPVGDSSEVMNFEVIQGEYA